MRFILAYVSKRTLLALAWLGPLALAWPGEAYSRADSDVSLLLELDRREYVVTEPILVRVIIRNGGPDVRFAELSRLARFLTLRVEGPSGVSEHGFAITVDSGSMRARSLLTGGEARFYLDATAVWHESSVVPRFADAGMYRLEVVYTSRPTPGLEPSLSARYGRRLVSKPVTVEFGSPDRVQGEILAALWENSSFFVRHWGSVFRGNRAQNAQVLRTVLERNPTNRLSNHVRLMLATDLVIRPDEARCAEAKELLTQIRRERPSFRYSEVGYWLAWAEWRRGQGNVDRACELLADLCADKPELRFVEAFLKWKRVICYAPEARKAYR